MKNKDATSNVYDYNLITFERFGNDVEMLSGVQWDVYNWVGPIAQLPCPLKEESICCDNNINFT